MAESHARPPLYVRVGDLLAAFTLMQIAIVKATARRLIGRRRRPTWGFFLELMTEGYRGFCSVLARIGFVRFRYILEFLLTLPSPLRGGVVPRAVRVQTDFGGLDAAWFEPPVADGPVIYYLHGGGFAFGSVRTHTDLVGALARASGARAFALDYRLAPEHRAPAALTDALAGYRDLLAQGIPPERIVFMGDSAGGNLVLNALRALRDAGEPLPAAGVGISPGVDFDCSGASMQTNADSDWITLAQLQLIASEYLAGRDPRGSDGSPLLAELSGLPPLLLQAGGAEVLVDQIRAFAGRAREAGVDVQLSVYEDMVHVWHLFGSLTPRAQEAIDEIGAFVRKHAAG